jgi:hypothetical protein
MLRPIISSNQIYIYHPLNNPYLKLYKLGIFFISLGILIGVGTLGVSLYNQFAHIPLYSGNITYLVIIGGVLSTLGGIIGGTLLVKKQKEAREALLVYLKQQNFADLQTIEYQHYHISRDEIRAILWQRFEETGDYQAFHQGFANATLERIFTPDEISKVRAILWKRFEETEDYQAIHQSVEYAIQNGIFQVEEISNYPKVQKALIEYINHYGYLRAKEHFPSFFPNEFSEIILQGFQKQQFLGWEQDELLQAVKDQVLTAAELSEILKKELLNYLDQKGYVATREEYPVIPKSQMRTYLLEVLKTSLLNEWSEEDASQIIADGVLSEDELSDILEKQFIACFKERGYRFTKEKYANLNPEQMRNVLSSQTYSELVSDRNIEMMLTDKVVTLKQLRKKLFQEILTKRVTTSQRFLELFGTWPIQKGLILPHDKIPGAGMDARSYYRGLFVE